MGNTGHDIALEDPHLPNDQEERPGDNSEEAQLLGKTE